MSAIVDAWNTRDPEQVVALYQTDGVRHQFALPPARLEGHAAIREMVGAIMHAVPSFVLSERSRIETGDTAILEWTFSGVVENDFGDLPGKGQSLTLDGVTVASMRDGLIAEERVYWDTATMLAGAGLLG